MPATLGHIGVQYLATRAVDRGIDPKWIFAGCVIPDLPWILQRVIVAVFDFSPFEVRAYAIAQSSLALSMVFCLCLAQFSTERWRVFGVLSLGALLHLLLDAAQTKWANGVVLFAPFHWDLTNFGLFWPEDWTTYALHAFSVAAIVWLLLRIPRSGRDLVWPSLSGLGFAVMCFGIYIAAPFAMKADVKAADLHYIYTLEEIDARPGRQVAFDRNLALAGTDGSSTLRAWFGEEFVLLGDLPDDDHVLSVEGIFVDRETVAVARFHVHASGIRAYATYLGLLFIALWWGLCLYDRIRV